MARRARKKPQRTAEVVRLAPAAPGPDIEALRRIAARTERNLKRYGRVIDNGNRRARRRVSQAATGSMVFLEGNRLLPHWWQFGWRLRRWIARRAAR